MKLTKEEEAVVLAFRKKAEENMPIKEGFLKEDLYEYVNDDDWMDNIPFWLYTIKEKNKAIKEVSNSFKKVLKKGTRFVCFLDKGAESWYDDPAIFGVEDMDEKWAKLYLENIRKI